MPWSQRPIYPQRSSHGPLFQLPLLGYLHLTWPVPRTGKRAIITERKPGNNVHDEASGCRPPNACTEWLRGIATRDREMHAYMHSHQDLLDEKKKARENRQKQSRGAEGGREGHINVGLVRKPVAPACAHRVPASYIVLTPTTTTTIKTARPATTLHYTLDTTN